MKYLSVFVTIVAVWIAIILIALIPQPTASRYSLYLAGLACNGILFVIGFWKRA
jgi:hypothetical protein